MSLEAEPDTALAGEPDAPLAGETNTALAGETNTLLAGEPDTLLAGEPDAALAGEPDTALAGEPSTPLTAWMIPTFIIFGAALLSAWVHGERLPAHAQAGSPALALTLLGTPAVAALAFVGLRRVARLPGTPATFSGDLLIIVVTAFFFGLHAAVLAVAMGVLASLQTAVLAAVGLLFVGLGPVLSIQEHGSPMGLRTPGTLADARAWQRAHRRAGRVFVAGGLAALAAGVGLPGPLAVAVVAAVVSAAVVASVAVASRERVEPSHGVSEGAARDPDRARPEPGGGE